jgi:simple sugar transport system permease protein
VGGNAIAARAAGIRVSRTVLAVFVAACVLAALAGLLLTGRLAAVTAGQGQNMIFTVFAAAVIGGISLNGGRGSVLGALLGVLLLGVISNILTLSPVVVADPVPHAPVRGARAAATRRRRGPGPAS